MDKRFILFMLLAMAILWANLWIMQQLNPDPLPKQKETADGAELLPPPRVEPPLERADQPPPPTVREEEFPRQWVALGSADPDSDFRMVAVLNSRGAAVEWVGLNSERYKDLDDLFYRRGYLGHLALTNELEPAGARVNVVGAGTPAALATPLEAGGEPGLRPGDIIQYAKSGTRGEKEIRSVADLDEFLAKWARIDDLIDIQVLRQGKPLTFTARAAARPLEVIKPEGYDPALSFLLTLAELDKQKLEKDPGWSFVPGGDRGAEIESVAPDSPAARAGLKKGNKITKIDSVPIAKPADAKNAFDRATVPAGAYVEVFVGDHKDPLHLTLPPELPGVRLLDVDWEVKATDHQTYVEFRRKLPALRLDLIKRYRLAKADAASNQPGYHLTLDVEIINLDNRGRELAYQLDGAQGLPTEGWWYSSKVSRNSAAGTRDLVYRDAGATKMVDGPEIAAGSNLAIIQPAKDSDLEYIAVDARSFAAVLKPQKDESQQSTQWIATAQPILVGPLPVDRAYYPLANVSFRLTSTQLKLEAAGAAGGQDRAAHSYLLFVGPKDSDVLATSTYGFEDLIYYGWPIFSFVATVMTSILHAFHWIWPHNYGLAIILLTVVVRLAMFPLSRKQALGAQKMQKLQPELKRIAEKYKNNVEQRMKEQRALFRKHNYNPAGGCLLVFIQLPVFIGLYKALSADIALRQTPLIDGFYWCSDLSAPDRLFNWTSFMPGFITAEKGMFSLGPYFNLLPIITIALFIWQQKMFMPPPTDEQQRMQQKTMNIMMIFMGFLFFYVPSGLCIYFIASSLWGIAERKLLPKMAHQEDAKPVVRAAASGERAPGATFAHDASKKKRRKRR
jgi:YidC/Oxa1 family membrane protein insertase